MLTHRTLCLGATAVTLLALVACARGENLTETQLAQAQSRWQQAGPRNYTLTMTITGDRIEEGRFVATVRDGALSSVTRNHRPIARPAPFYTVPGLFDFLSEELEMAAQPGRYWQAARDARVYQRIRFDDRLGYPTRYLRAVTGTEHNVTLDLELSADDR